jgi:hypothetical protein
MANLVTTEANNILAASSGQAPYVAPVLPVVVSLVTVMGTASAPGTEVVNTTTPASQYARQTVTFAAPGAGSIASNNALTFVNMPAATIVGVDEFDSASTPIRRWFGPLSTTKSVNAGDTFSVSIGSYSKSMS